MSWTARRLNQLGYLSRGRSRHRPRDAVHLYNGPYPFVQTGDVKHAGLYITDYELEEAKVSPDRLKAAAISHIRWYRLPSNTEENTAVTSNWIWLDSTWRLDSQDSGPFATDLKL